ncbi:MAG: S41 family peptidase [Phycisphaerales bacterium]|nr:S41 family peptidase [Phycisphaerales bacterium]
MPKRNLAWILVVAVIALLMWQLPQTIARRDSVLKAFGALVDARAQIHRRYVDSVDESKLVDAAVDAGIRAMIHDLNDPHAVYLNENDYKRFQDRTDGRYGGIGVEVWITELGLEVLSREPNSPAIRAEILPGDIITHIDSRPTTGMPLAEVANMLHGPPDTAVKLTVITPSDKAREVTLFRAIIKLDPIHGWSRSPSGGWRFMLDPELGIGYVRLVKFTPDLAIRLDEEIDLLLRRNLRGLILDLRENTGGLLDSAREVADKFLERGLIVRTSGRKADEKQWFAMREGTYPNFPLSVLVNGSTASAAEIVAGALRDHKRAVVVGERTYGKGSVQEVVELNDNNGAIKLTTAYYYLPSGRCIHRAAKANRDGEWGVEPNLPVKLSDAQRSKWLVAWRDIGREIVDDAPDRPTTMPTSVKESEGREAVEALLNADRQLRKALEYHRELLKREENPESASKDQPVLDDIN